jgi:hypothetical protein
MIGEILVYNFLSEHLKTFFYFTHHERGVIYNF